MSIAKSFSAIMIFSMLVFLLCLLPEENSSAKTVSGSCGKKACWSYNTKSKKLEISGKGRVSEIISVKKALHKKRNTFFVKSIIIKEGITAIKDASVLKYANTSGSYTKVSLPDSFRVIPCNIFSKLSLKKLYIPENVIKIEDGAFWSFNDLTEITVSKDNEKYIIKDDVLFTKNFSTLLYYPQYKQDKSYSIPSSVTKIAPLALAKNKYLEKLYFPSTLKQIGAGAFFKCCQLEQTNIAQLKRLKKIEDYDNAEYILFTGTAWDEGPLSYYNSFSDGDIFSMPSSDPRRYLGTFEGTALKTFKMPVHLKYIASETFRNCGFLKKMVVGKNFMGNINYGAPDKLKSTFLCLVPLQTIKVADGNEKYMISSHGLYTKDKKILCQTFADNRFQYALSLRRSPEKKKTYVIGKKTQIIANGAFYNSSYSRVRVKGNLKSIGSYAFTFSKIKEINFKGYIKEIQSYAFFYSNIKSFHCNQSVFYIEKGAFQESSRLKEVYLGTELKYLGDYAFYLCEKLKKVVFSLNTVLGNGVFEECSRLDRENIVRKPSQEQWEKMHERWKQLQSVLVYTAAYCTVLPVSLKNLPVGSIYLAFK